MKKLMMMLGVVAMAAAVQAATVTWSTGKFQTPGTGGNGWSGSTLSAATDGAYLAEIFFFTDASCQSKFAVAGVTGTTDDTSTKTGKSFGAETNDKFTAGETYYTYLTLTENATGATLTSEVVSFTVGTLQAPDVNFWAGSGFDQTKLDATYGMYKTTGWVAAAVPEPTSGLLLLIGMAGLALRRRRA